MSQRTQRLPISESILEEATAWFIDFNEGELDVGGRERFHQWLRRSPEHVRAYLEIAAAWEDSARLNRGQPVDHAAVIAEALAESNVVRLDTRATLGQAGDSTSRSALQGKHRGLRLVSVAAALLAAIGAACWVVVHHNFYSTDVGEQRSIVLADGSTVELNARSRLSVTFSKEQRIVNLLEGQALFNVRKKDSRPFVVVSGGIRVQALGTEFDVYQKTTGTVVTVLEGRVAVGAGREPTVDLRDSPPVGAEARILLSAGEQVTVTGRAPAQPKPANISTAIAWTQRKLVFDETPLADAAAEFNRYNIRQIVIEDPTLASYHIRGSFDSGDPDRLIQFLRERFDADVLESEHEIRISSKKIH
jgi:transmembrane sensor